MKIEFVHECKIPNSTAQQRRMTARGGFLPARTLQAKAFWQALFEQHTPPQPFTGPLSLIVIFLYARKNAKEIYKTTKPDLDNLIKMVQDAMQHTGYFINDSQISILSVGKYYSDREGVQVSLEQLEDKHE